MDKTYARESPRTPSPYAYFSVHLCVNAINFSLTNMQRTLQTHAEKEMDRERERERELERDLRPVGSR